LGADGFLSGEPTTPGTYTFKVTATNASGSQTAGPITMNIRIVPTFTAESAPANALVGSPYSFKFIATGAPTPTLALASGTLPPGLTFNPTTGLLSGKPTTVGSYAITISVSHRGENTF